MKKITLIFFTFSGIYNGLAQEPVTATDTGIVVQKIQLITQPDVAAKPQVQDKPAVQLYPNPARNKVELDIKGFDPGYLQIFLLNNNGKEVKAEKRLLLYGTETVVFMFSEEKGLYHLVLKQGTRSVRTKLLIQ